MNIQYNNLLEFIKKNKILIAFYILFVLIIVPTIIFFLSQFQKKEPLSHKERPSNAITTPTTVLADLSVQSVSPIDGRLNIGIFPTLQATFSRPITNAEQSTIKLSTSPTISGTTQWSQNGQIISFTPTEPLKLSQKYNVTLLYSQNTYVWTFTTVSIDNISTEDQIRAQESADKYYGEWQKNVEDNYPWYNKLPLQTDDYFVYFDLDLKQFTAKLYPKQASNETIDDQVKRFKTEIITNLNSFGIQTLKYKFQWNIEPT